MDQKSKKQAETVLDSLEARAKSGQCSVRFALAAAFAAGMQLAENIAKCGTAVEG